MNALGAVVADDVALAVASVALLATGGGIALLIMFLLLEVVVALLVLVERIHVLLLELG